MNDLAINEQHIQHKIFTLRNQQVMLDRDLAELYQVETRALKQAVKMNIDRFPDDFMFELTEDEIDFMVSQNVIPSKNHLGGAKPYAFTEQGVSMLSAVLKSKRNMNWFMAEKCERKMLTPVNSPLFIRNKTPQLFKEMICLNIFYI